MSMIAFTLSHQYGAPSIDVRIVSVFALANPYHLNGMPCFVNDLFKKKFIFIFFSSTLLVGIHKYNFCVNDSDSDFHDIDILPHFRKMSANPNANINECRLDIRRKSPLTSIASSCFIVKFSSNWSFDNSNRLDHIWYAYNTRILWEIIAIRLTYLSMVTGDKRHQCAN